MLICFPQATEPTGGYIDEPQSLERMAVLALFTPGPRLPSRSHGTTTYCAVGTSAHEGARRWLRLAGEEAYQATRDAILTCAQKLT